MIQDDINQFENMIADCYSIYIGTKRTIEIVSQAFKLANANTNPNIVFYEIESTKKTEGKLASVKDNNLKIEILKKLHIL